MTCQTALKQQNHCETATVDEKSTTLTRSTCVSLTQDKRSSSPLCSYATSKYNQSGYAMTSAFNAPSYAYHFNGHFLDDSGCSAECPQIFILRMFGNRTSGIIGMGFPRTRCPSSQWCQNDEEKSKHCPSTRENQAQSEYKHSQTFCVCICCHSNETRLQIRPIVHN